MKKKRWFVFREDSPHDLEARLNVLAAEHYEIFTILDTSGTEGFDFVIVAYKWVR